MHFRIYILLPLLALAGCAALQPGRPAAPEVEYRRASNPAFFLPRNHTPKTSVADMDRDLSRRHWMVNKNTLHDSDGYRYEVVVTPLTAPLLERMSREETLRRNIPLADMQKLTSNLIRALVEEQSCFEVFVKAPSLIGHDFRVDYYAISYHTLGMKPIAARPLTGNAKYSSVVELTRSLLDSYLSVGVWEDDARNIRGIGNYSRQVVCGPRVNLGRPFAVHVRPRYDLSLESKTLSWTVPALAE